MLLPADSVLLQVREAPTMLLRNLERQAIVAAAVVELSFQVDQEHRRHRRSDGDGPREGVVADLSSKRGCFGRPRMFRRTLCHLAWKEYIAFLSSCWVPNHTGDDSGARQDQSHVDLFVPRQSILCWLQSRLHKRKRCFSNFIGVQITTFWGLCHLL